MNQSRNKDLFSCYIIKANLNENHVGLKIEQFENKQPNYQPDVSDMKIRVNWTNNDNNDMKYDWGFENG